MSGDRRILVTCGRFHPATGIVRALHQGPCRIDVVDSFKLATAMHSNAVAKLHVAAAAAPDPVQYAQDIAEIVQQRGIDLVVPSYEDGFFLARYADKILAPLFAPTFETIAHLHDKARFIELCAGLGLPAPKTEVVASREDLRTAIGQFDAYVARPAYSRGGMVYLTNHGPRSGEIGLDDCDPTAENPWLVQDYIEGNDACSFSVVRNGRILVHCVYEPTIQASGGFSVQFSSIEDFGSLEVTSTICARFNYTGFIGFDFRRTADGFVMMECNPRSSAGVFLTPKAWVADAIVGDPTETRIVEPGARRQYDAFLFQPGMVQLPARRLVQELLTTPDVYISAEDMLPALYFFINLRHWSKRAEREHIDFGQAFIGDVSWDGAPMPDWPTTTAR
ncbi:MAG: ATP-grasp domain-containing protein [Pseudomonadota bacterium]